MLNRDSKVREASQDEDNGESEELVGKKPVSLTSHNGTQPTYLKKAKLVRGLPYMTSAQTGEGDEKSTKFADKR